MSSLYSKKKGNIVGVWEIILVFVPWKVERRDQMWSNGPGTRLPVVVRLKMVDKYTNITGKIAKCHL